MTKLEVQGYKVTVFNNTLFRVDLEEGMTPVQKERIATAIFKYLVNEGFIPPFSWDAGAKNLFDFWLEVGIVIRR